MMNPHSPFVIIQYMNNHKDSSKSQVFAILAIFTRDLGHINPSLLWNHIRQLRFIPQSSR